MTRKIPVAPEWQAQAHLQKSEFERLYQQSIASPEAFWAEQSKRLSWRKPATRIKDTSFHHPVRVQWFADGEINVSENCVDRHLPDKQNKVAFYWEPDDPNGAPQTITYGQLAQQMNKVCHALVQLGVKKGDRVTVYLPMIPEAVYVMLACARIGAVHSVVFAGFSAEAIAGRIQDCESEVVVTADFAVRGGKTTPLKENVDEALKKCPGVKKVLVVERTKGEIQKTPGRDVLWSEIVPQQSGQFPAPAHAATDPLFILYTSGSTNKPKGVLHGMGGYLLFTSLTHELIFNYKSNDVYWCTADVGWVTGHSYIVYGPLSNGATSVLFEGAPTWPTPSRIWEIVDRYQVQILYTAPTLVRALMKEGQEFVQSTSRKSLRILGSVGEPINPEAWEWYFKQAGREHCPIVDTWWQTETGGILISPLPGVSELKPGSASHPFFGVQPALISEAGQEIHGPGQGYLCLKDSWPGQMISIYKDQDRFEKTYFSQYPGFYFTGDGATRDEDGDYWITGRVDDVINVSGHRMGTAEIESALVSNPAVAEAAVVGFPHDIKGQGIYAFVTLKSDHQPTPQLKTELIEWVKSAISAIARPDVIQWAPSLPKTRSGKIMRRILRKIAQGDTTNLGDVTTLADPSVVQQLIAGQKSPA